MPSQINAFNQARKIEAVGMQHLLPFFKEHSFEGRFVLTDKGPLARELQKMAGDVILTHHNGDTLAIECKIEKSSDYGNFFLETWSNRSRFPFLPFFRQAGPIHNSHAALEGMGLCRAEQISTMRDGPIVRLS